MNPSWKPLTGDERQHEEGLFLLSSFSLMQHIFFYHQSHSRLKHRTRWLHGESPQVSEDQAWRWFHLKSTAATVSVTGPLLSDDMIDWLDRSLIIGLSESQSGWWVDLMLPSLTWSELTGRTAGRYRHSLTDANVAPFCDFNILIAAAGVHTPRLWRYWLLLFVLKHQTGSEVTPRLVRYLLLNPNKTC